MAEELEYHLYRHFRAAPTYRYAATIVADPKRPAGFRVTHSEPSVADATFMAGLDRFFRAVHPALKTEYTKAAIIDKAVEAKPGDPDYIDACLDAMQGANFCHAGRRPPSFPA